MDITQLILDDHYAQRRLFAILEQLRSTHKVTLAAVWSRLSEFLEIHAATEEEIFYPALLRAGLRSGHAKGSRMNNPRGTALERVGLGRASVRGHG